MSKLMVAFIISAGLGFAGTGMAQAQSPMSKENYKLAKKDADAQYKVDKDACRSRSGSAKAICVAEAKGKYNTATAEAEAAYKNTPKARENARIVHAQATYNVAIEKCGELAGNRKDVCVKEAKAELVKGKANAKVDRVTTDTREEAATKQAEARKDANEEKRDADYTVAIQKCDSLAGPAKDSCVSNAKAQFGKP